MSDFETVRVTTPSGVYDVRIGPGAALRSGDVLTDRVQRALLVEDTGIPQDDRDEIAASLAASGRIVSRVAITPTEKTKSLETLGVVLKEAATARLDRNDAVVALGGGVVGDVAGFAAASYRRGVAVVQCPTTLLSMVDASVGGKTGVNLPVGQRLLKNMAGAFHQPIGVLADTTLLRSLDDRVYRCGLAECVKHAMISGGLGGMTRGSGGNDDLAWLEAHADALVARDEPTLRDLIKRHVSIKAAVVASDERETDGSGGRALLNLGHTFAHAIETLDGVTWSDGEHTFAGLMHGEAVALGLLAACETSHALGRCEADLRARVEKILECVGLPTSVAGLPVASVITDAMRDDKKVSGGSMRLVLPTGAGQTEIVPCDDAVAIGRGIASIAG